MTETADVAQTFTEECATGARIKKQRRVTPKHAPVVYFVQDGEGGPIKIGTSTNMPARMNTLLNEVRNGLRILGTIDGGFSLETHLHTRFRHLWIRGEWFQNHPDIVAVATGKAPADETAGEVLEALKALLEACDEGPWDSQRYIRPGALEQARAAIANATKGKP